MVEAMFVCAMVCDTGAGVGRSSEAKNRMPERRASRIKSCLRVRVIFLEETVSIYYTIYIDKSQPP